MPIAAIGPAFSIGGALLGGLGKSGKQGGVTQNQNSTTDFNKSETGSQSSEGFQRAIESPYFSQFRQSLLPMFASEWSKTQQPIFGQGEQANFLGQLNSLRSSATESLKQSLARSGALNSGRFGAGLEGINRAYMDKASNYFAGLPLQEEMARRQASSNLLGLGFNFAGRDPLSYQTSNQATSLANTTGQEKRTGTMDQTQTGPSWWSGLASGLGGIAGGIGGRATDSYGKSKGWW